MLSLRQSLAKIGKKPPIRIHGDLSLPCKSLRDNMIAWNHQIYPLLIIAPQEFVYPLKELADYKSSTGMATMLLSLDHIYQSFPGRDEAEQVKRCLALFQANNKARYAMLVGDVDKFPVRFTKWYYLRDYDDPNNDPEFHSCFIPTDLYYAALFKPDGSFDDWDANRDGYYEIPSTGTNPDNVSVIPNIAIGRIPASTKDDIIRYISKIKEYEGHANGSQWVKSALLVEGDWDLSAHLHLDSIASKYLQGYNIYKLYLSGAGNTHTPYPANINSCINPPNGVGLVIYIGHGAIDRWEIDPTISYGPSELDKLTNTEALPIIFAMACNTGRFVFFPPITAYRDINGKDHNGTDNGEIFTTYPPQPACLQTNDQESMAEHSTVMRNTGAIAYIGCAINSQDNTYEILDPFIKGVSSSITLGAAWLNAVNSLYKKYPLGPSGPAENSGEIFTVPWKFNLFGDPSLRLAGI